MPIRIELRRFYGHHWRTVTRPRILTRDGHRCTRCKKIGIRLDIAHLKFHPPHPRHDEDNNLAAMCDPCHKAHDYAAWALACWLTRTAKKDAARPLLEGVA